MEALIAVALMFLPAIIYFVRSPIRPDQIDVLIALLGIFLGLALIIYLGNFLFPPRQGYWIAFAGWILMCVYSWNISGKEREEKSSKSRYRPLR